uniref:Uncharacterized protein n=1 Tax=Leersia perrieri TaxID=77586 RepID=A0A0D9WJ64_9ORYZ
MPCDGCLRDGDEPTNSARSVVEIGPSRERGTARRASPTACRGVSSLGTGSTGEEESASPARGRGGAGAGAGDGDGDGDGERRPRASPERNGNDSCVGVAWSDTLTLTWWVMGVSWEKSTPR